MYLAIYHSRSSTKRVLLKAHDIKTSGHLGFNKTCEKIKDRFNWPQWEKQVREYILSCETCQKIFYTKWVEIHAIRDTQAKTVAKCLIKFICRHGIPDQLHSDQGTSYRNELLDYITDQLFLICTLGGQ
jgi:hypothetical protein